MAALQEFRRRYPQYEDMPDAALADAIYGKFYADMPRDDFDAKIGLKKMGVVEDVVRSAATGIGEGVTQGIGLLGDVQGLADSGGEWVGDILGLPKMTPEQRKRFENPFGLPDISAPTTAAIEKATGFDQVKHQPETTAGDFMRTGMAFATPAAVAGIGRGVVKTATKYGAIPGVASEAAGQATEGTALEPWARAGAALTAGGVTAFLSRPTTAAAILKKNMPAGVTTNDIMKADRLMAEGRRIGVPLTWPEALHRVTDGRVDITGLQRILEQTKGGGPVIGPTMAARPAQTGAAMTGAMDDLTAGAQMIDPRVSGRAIQEAAEGSIDFVRKQINAAAEPYYNAAAGTRVPIPPSLHGDPLYQEALQAVRKDPVHSRFVAGLPDDSVGVQNEIKKYFDRLADRAAPLGDKTAASVYGGVGRNVRDAAKQASPDYERALGLEADLRREFLNPAEAGPLGKMAKTDDILAQGRALLASRAAEGSEQAVSETIRLLSRRSPDDALQLVRTHLRGVFDEATQNLIAGSNQWGGAKFTAAIRGNPQQAKNLEAAVKALPDGDARWEGLNAFLDVLEATGRRQRPGSLTAFNAEALDEMKRGGLPTEAARSIRTVGARLFDFYDQWKLGKNTAELAQIITDPNSAKMLRDLANARTPGGRQALAGYLVTYYATQAGTKPLPAVQDQR